MFPALILMLEDIVLGARRHVCTFRSPTQAELAFLIVVMLRSPQILEPGESVTLVVKTSVPLKTTAILLLSPIVRLKGLVDSVQLIAHPKVCKML